MDKDKQDKPQYMTAEELAAAIRKTEDGSSYLRCSFGPGWIKGELVDQKDEG